MGTAQRPGSAAGTLPRRGRFTLIPPTLNLALSRLRQTWRLVLVTELGLLGAVLLVSAVPLFSLVAISSGLRGALAASPSGPVLTTTVFAFRPSRDGAQQAGAQIDSLMHEHLAPYLAGGPSFNVQTYMGVSKVAPPTGGTSQRPQGPQGPQTSLSLDGRDPSEAASHVRLLSGRLPAANSAQVEVALTSDTADALGAQTGDTLYGLLFSGPNQATSLPLHVVGVYTPTSATDPYWGNNQPYGRGYVVRIGPGGSVSENAALASADTLIAAMSDLASGSSVSGKGGPIGNVELQMYWRYRLALDHISADDLGTLTSQYNELRNQLENRLTSQGGIGGVDVYGALDALNFYQARAVGIQVVVILLLLQVLGLVILFVSLAAGILVERQGEAIALLRSRGAHRRQILGALSLQGLGASAVALVAGPLLAIPLVRLIAGSLLPTAEQQGLSVLDRSPLALAWDVRWYALIAVLGAATAIVVSILRAANRNVLALRRESARASAPFWQRLNLDLIGAAFLIAIYIFYLWGIEQIPYQARQYLGALALILSPLLLVAIALVFGRVFPLALRAAARFSARGSGAASTIALAQMARAPRQSSRMLLLLSLATAFTLFTLILTVSQAAHVVALTDFQVGADFSGTLSSSLVTPAAPATPPTLADLTQRYKGIAGVAAASIGYQGTSVPRNEPPVSIVAVDASSYADAALWSPKYSSQSLGDLMKPLADRRANAVTNSVVPAIVDDATWVHLSLTSDGQFTLPFDNNGDQVKFVAVARVANIPPIVDTPDYNFGTTGGLLVDYETFAAAYKATTGAANAAALAPNMVWLHTGDDAGSLASVRAALTTGDLKLADLLDRRQMLADAQSDPLQLDLTGALGLGAVTSLLLALVGAWTATWLNARSRLTSFAVLRALGTTPRQILSLLLWEQGIVYVSALALSVGLGLLLAQAALPALIFISAIGRTGANGGGPPIDVPAAEAILPVGEVALVLGGIAAVCTLAVTITTFVLSRASLGEALRLNQD